MLNIIQKLTHTSLPDTTTNAGADLLKSCSLPDPDRLRRDLAAIDSQIAVDDEAWERLDRVSNPHAFTEQQTIAARRGRLERERDALRRQLAAAEKARAALVALAEMVDSMDRQIADIAQRLYGGALVMSRDERLTSFQMLDGLARARARIAAAIAVVVPARQYRRSIDPVRTFTDELRAMADEIDRLHAPGMPRQTMPLPSGARELIAALNEGR
jgi:hypothetical protein